MKIEFDTLQELQVFIRENERFDLVDLEIEKKEYKNLFTGAVFREPVYYTEFRLLSEGDNDN